MEKKEEKTIDQQSTLWNNKILISSFVVLIIGTNSFNAYIHQQDTNTVRIELEAKITEQKIQYEKERSDKKDERVLAEAKQMILSNNYILEIARLNRELER